MQRSVVLGVAGYLPERILTNDELATKVDTSDAWIVERTGIRQRHIAALDQRTTGCQTVVGLGQVEHRHQYLVAFDLLLLHPHDVAGTRARGHGPRGGSAGAGHGLSQAGRTGPPGSRG